MPATEAKPEWHLQSWHVDIPDVAGHWRDHRVYRSYDDARKYAVRNNGSFRILKVVDCEKFWGHSAEQFVLRPECIDH